MKALLTISLLLIAAPAAAQDGTEEGIDLMAEAMRLFMRGLMTEMEPALDDLTELLDSIDSYHAPEMLPNGDIIIRKKTPMELDMENDDGEVEL